MNEEMRELKSVYGGEMSENKFFSGVKVLNRGFTMLFIILKTQSKRTAQINRFQ